MTVALPTTALLPTASLGGLGPYVVAAFALLVAALAIAIQFEFVRAALGGRPTERPERTNCPSCGVRVDADAGSCPHCDAALDKD